MRMKCLTSRLHPKQTWDGKMIERSIHRASLSLYIYIHIHHISIDNLLTREKKGEKKEKEKKGKKGIWPWKD